ncbi:MAG: hypothetical protein P8P74_10360 [Crocinitomicaceae bacterium]|nr:hypothetical protein [Crocinitomicaceae bacterium]
MKQSTYSILEDREVLINEKIFDDQNNLVHSIDYSLRPEEEKKFVYNEKGLLIREESLVEGRVGDSLELDYDDNGKLLQQRHNINGDLYEKTTVEKTDNTEKRTTIQDGEESQRVEMEADGDVKTYRFYDFGELAQVNTVIKEGNKITTKSEIPGTEQFYLEVQILDDDGNLIESSEYVGEDHHVSSFKQEYEEKKRTKTIFENFSQPHLSYEEIFTFDENGNRTVYEKLDMTGRLMRFEKVRFNDQNKPVEIAGNDGNSKFHHRIDYDNSI